MNKISHLRCRTNRGTREKSSARLAYDCLESRQLLAANLDLLAGSVETLQTVVSGVESCQPQGNHQNSEEDSAEQLANTCTDDTPITIVALGNNFDLSAIGGSGNTRFDIVQKPSSPDFNFRGTTTNYLVEITDLDSAPTPDPNTSGIRSEQSTAEKVINSQLGQARNFEPVSLMASAKVTAALPTALLKLNVSHHSYFATQQTDTLKTNLASARTGLIDQYQSFSVIDTLPITSEVTRVSQASHATYPATRKPFTFEIGAFHDANLNHTNETLNESALVSREAAKIASTEMKNQDMVFDRSFANLLVSNQFRLTSHSVLNNYGMRTDSPIPSTPIAPDIARPKDEIGLIAADDKEPTVVQAEFSATGSTLFFAILVGIQFCGQRESVELNREPVTKNRKSSSS